MPRGLRIDRIDRVEPTTSRQARKPRQRTAAPRYLSGFVAELSGHWETGGFLEFLINDEVSDRVSLGPAPWSLMAILFEEGIRADHWMDAFVQTARLENSLGERGVINPPTAQKIYNLAADTRAKLARTKVRKRTGSASKPGKAWAEQLLASEPPHGYRIALAPQNLKLIIRAPKSRRDALRDFQDEGEKRERFG